MARVVAPEPVETKGHLPDRASDIDLDAKHVAESTQLEFHRDNAGHRSAEAGGGAVVQASHVDLVLADKRAIPAANRPSPLLLSLDGLVAEEAVSGFVIALH
jgi:hypothetical protein